MNEVTNALRKDVGVCTDTFSGEFTSFSIS